MALKALRLANDSPTLETDTSFVGQFTPATGFSVGYQSPERWPVQWQARLGATGWNQKQHRSVTADIAAYIPLPIAIVSQRAEIFGFGSYQSTDISQSDSVSSLVKNFSIKVSDTIVGGGLRLLWL